MPEEITVKNIYYSMLMYKEKIRREDGGRLNKALFIVAFIIAALKD